MRAQSVLTLLFVATLGFAQVSDTAQTYTTKRIFKAPKIDGDLSDEAWRDADSITRFTVLKPIEGSKPTQRNDVRIVYDDIAIYVSAMYYDTDPDSIAKEQGTRDASLNADKIRFLLDPYNKRQDAYEFYVYASGVQGDYRFSDFNYDAVWWSAVKMHANGWSVEMKIPYSSLRFPDVPEQVWAMQVTRDITRNREFQQWNLTPQAGGNSQRFWGTLHGIKDIKPPLRLALTPYLSGYYAQSPVLNADGTYSSSKGFSYNAGADIKYGINESFTIDMTLLPDFGQVQTDSKVKNIGYREVNYAENRPFFKEGTELFNKRNLFYSRRIGKTPTHYYNVLYSLNPGDKIIQNPQQARLLNATKITGRTKGGLGVGLLNSVTDDTYAIVRDSLGSEHKTLTEPLTNFNVVVFDQQLKNNSSVYFINTNVIHRDKTYDDANVSAAGTTLSSKNNSYAVDGAAAFSQVFNKIDTTKNSNVFENTLGYNYYVGARKTSGNFMFGLYHNVYNNTFNALDMGYFQLNNYKNYGLNLNYNYYNPFWKIFRNTYNNINVNYSQNYLTSKRTDLSFNGNLYATFMNFCEAWTGGGFTPVTNIDYFEPRVPGMFYISPQYYYSYVGFNTDPRKKLFGILSLNMANFFKNNPQKFPNWLGYGFESTVRYRASNKLNFTVTYNYNTDPYNVGFANFDYATGDVVFGGRELNTHISTLGLNYVLKNDMVITLNGRHYWSTGEYVQYYTLRNDGWLDKNDTYELNNNSSFNYNAFTIDLVYSWIFSPASKLTIGYKNIIETDEFISMHPKYGTNFSNTMTAPQTNVISLKVLYFLDYQYFKKFNKTTAHSFKLRDLFTTPV